MVSLPTSRSSTQAKRSPAHTGMPACALIRLIMASLLFATRPVDAAPPSRSPSQTNQNRTDGGPAGMPAHDATDDITRSCDSRAWAALWGTLRVESDQLVLEGRTRAVYQNFRWGAFSASFQYRVHGAGARPIVYYNARLGGPRGPLCGSFVRLPQSSAIRPDVDHWHNVRLDVDRKRTMIFIDGRPGTTIHSTIREPGTFVLGVDGPLGTSVRFRQIQFHEKNYVALFGGRSLEHWEGAGASADKCWTVEDGLLVCTGQKGPWLRTRRSFGDFNLRLEYRVKPGGNSGVYIRVPPDGNHHGQDAGIEVQILDDAAARYKNLKAYQFAGSLYAVEPAIPGTAHPAGLWNALEINCRGYHYQVWHNGRPVIDADAAAVPELRRRLVEGFIGLQNHSERVWFRDVRIGPPQ